jgi:hypothetical protein
MNFDTIVSWLRSRFLFPVDITRPGFNHDGWILFSFSESGVVWEIDFSDAINHISQDSPQREFLHDSNLAV